MFKIFLNNFSCLFSNSIREGLRGQFRFFKISRRVQPFSLNNNDQKKKKNMSKIRQQKQSRPTYVPKIYPNILEQIKINFQLVCSTYVHICSSYTPTMLRIQLFDHSVNKVVYGKSLVSGCNTFAYRKGNEIY